jgi:hypothetical protein
MGGLFVCGYMMVVVFFIARHGKAHKRTSKNTAHKDATHKKTRTCTQPWMLLFVNIAQ